MPTISRWRACKTSAADPPAASSPPLERIDPLYVQVRSAQEVDRVAVRLQEILEARHRPGARYRVDTLTAILTAAKNISLILSLVLVLVSAITLVISGIGIMNIMLV